MGLTKKWYVVADKMATANGPYATEQEAENASGFANAGTTRVVQARSDKEALKHRPIQ